MSLQFTDSEWSVMETLWAGGPLELGQVVDALKPTRSWSRNTVHTYLTRLEKKGAVAIDREHTPHLYRAKAAREDCAAQQRRSLVERAYHGSAGALVSAFVKDGSLTAREREELRRLLDEMEV